MAAVGGWDLPARSAERAAGWPRQLLHARMRAHSAADPASPPLPAALETLFLSGLPLGGSLSAGWELPAGLRYWLMKDANISGPLPNGWRLPAALAVRWAGGCGVLWPCVLKLRQALLPAAALALAPAHPAPRTHQVAVVLPARRAWTGAATSLRAPSPRSSPSCAASGSGVSRTAGRLDSRAAAAGRLGIKAPACRAADNLWGAAPAWPLRTALLTPCLHPSHRPGRQPAQRPAALQLPV